jgi:putative transposase
MEIREPSHTKVGIDYGLEHIANFSNGETIEQPRFLREEQTRLRLEQRKLSKKQKGGQNRRKQRIKVAKIHCKIERKRSDFQFKEAKKIVDRFGKIAFEDHSLQFMIKNKRLSQSTADRAIGSFKQKLSSQAHKAGRPLIEVSTTDAQGIGNSQKCLCGHVGKKKLSQRIHQCPACGVVTPRDHMASSIVEYRAFDTVPNWYQSAVGQTVKSLDRAMLAGLPNQEVTLPFLVKQEEKDTPDDPRTFGISDANPIKGAKATL